MSRRDSRRLRGSSAVSAVAALAGALTALVAFAALTGCAGPASPLASPLASPKLAGPAPLVLPFDEYKLSHQEESTLDQAHLALLKRCVQEHGVGFTMPESTDTPEPPVLPVNSRRYGVTDPATALRFGYHFPAYGGSEARSRQLAAWEEGLSQPERVAIYGEDGTSGCVAWAQAELSSGAPRADAGWLTTQDSRSLDDSAKDAAVVGAQAEWRKCMARVSLRYADSPAAINDPRWKLDSPTISASERTTAQADVRCKQSSRLVTVWHMVETTHQRAVIEQNPTMFDNLKANKQKRLSNARDVLSVPGTGA